MRDHPWWPSPKGPSCLEADGRTGCGRSNFFGHSVYVVCAGTRHTHTHTQLKFLFKVSVDTERGRALFEEFKSFFLNILQVFSYLKQGLNMRPRLPSFHAACASLRLPASASVAWGLQQAWASIPRLSGFAYFQDVGRTSDRPSAASG